jgi:hypothetical protein
VVFSVLYEKIALVSLLDAWFLCRIEFYLYNVVYQVVFISQAEYLVDVYVRHGVAVIRYTLQSD